MRVAVWHNLRPGGGKRALHDHIRFLVEHGHEVEAWCPPTAETAFAPLAGLCKEHVFPLRVPATGRRATWREIRDDRHDRLEAMAEHARGCLDQMEEAGFEVVLANTCSQFRVPPIGRLTTRPSLLYLQEPFRPLYEALPAPLWAAVARESGWTRSPSAVSSALRIAVADRQRRVQVREEGRNAAGYNRILCNSLYSRESIMRAYGQAATVCYLGVDERIFRPGGQRRSDFFLTVGAGFPEKNVDFVIRALARRTDRSWPLVWVCNLADDNYVQAVRVLAADLGVDLRVESGVPDHRLVELYQEAGLFLCAPILEPFGLPAVEAQACGLPVVATAEAGLRETVAHDRTGLLAWPDEAEFAAAVDQLVSDPGRRAAFGQAGREWVERSWTVAAAGQRLESELLEVLSPAPPR